MAYVCAIAHVSNKSAGSAALFFLFPYFLHLTEALQGEKKRFSLLAIDRKLIERKVYTKKHFKASLTLIKRPSSDLSQTSHCNIKGLSVSKVMRIENMITQVKFY